MSSSVVRHDSWTKDYEEVAEFPFEQDRMLPSHPLSPSLPMSQGAPSELPTSPSAASSTSPLLVGSHDHAHEPPHSFARPSRASSFKNLPSSPLNPASPPIPMPPSHSAPATPGFPSPFGRPGSRGSLNMATSPTPVPNFSRMANEELRALGGPYPGVPAHRGSMILYRRADSFVGTPVLPDDGGQLQFLPPPPIAGGDGGSNRGSMYSVSGDSISDSKYPPSLAPHHRGTMYSENRTSVAFSTYGFVGGRGLVAYAYDPEEDEDSEDDEEDWLHDPEVAYPRGTTSTDGSQAKVVVVKDGSSAGGHSNSTAADAKGKAVKRKQPVGPPVMKVWNWRGIINVATLIAMVAALFCLFLAYPVVRINLDEGVNARITGNTRVNSTGQAVDPADAVVDEDSSSSSSISRSLLNPGGVTFERRAYLASAVVSPSAAIGFVTASASPLPSPSPLPGAYVLPSASYHLPYAPVASSHPLVSPGSASASHPTVVGSSPVRLSETEAQVVLVSSSMTVVYEKTLCVGDAMKVELGWTLGSEIEERRVVLKRYSGDTDVWHVVYPDALGHDVTSSSSSSSGTALKVVFTMIPQGSSESPEVEVRYVKYGNGRSMRSNSRVMRTVECVLGEEELERAVRVEVPASS